MVEISTASDQERTTNDIVDTSLINEDKTPKNNPTSLELHITKVREKLTKYLQDPSPLRSFFDLDNKETESLIIGQITQEPQIKEQIKRKLIEYIECRHTNDAAALISITSPTSAEILKSPDVQKAVKAALIQALKGRTPYYNWKIGEIFQYLSPSQELVQSLEVQKTVQEVLLQILENYHTQVTEHNSYSLSDLFSEITEITNVIKLSPEVTQNLELRETAKAVLASKVEELFNPQIPQYHQKDHIIEITENFQLTEEVIYPVAQRVIIDRFQKDDLEGAFKVIEDFDYPDEVTQSPEVQLEAKRVVIKCIDEVSGDMDDVIQQVKDVFGLRLDLDSCKSITSEVEIITPLASKIFEDSEFSALTQDSVIRKHFRINELAEVYTNNRGLLEENPAKVAIQARMEYLETDGNLEQEDAKWYKKLSKIFGKEKISHFIGLEDYSYFHIAGSFILKAFNNSGLSSNAFYGQILSQVADDRATGTDAKTDFLMICYNLDYNFEEVIGEARQIPNPRLHQLLSSLEDGGVFSSWKNLKKFSEISQILSQREVLEKLEQLKQDDKSQQYDFFSQLAFHPNISVRKVFEFMNEPEEFLELEDEDCGESHERKKPSNYTAFPHLDISAEDLRDALVEGNMDQLQFFPEFTVDYRIPQQEITKEFLAQELVRALGKRSEKIPGEAKNPKKLFKILNKIFNSHKTSLQAVLQNPESVSSELKKELEGAIYEEKIALKDDRQFDNYRVKVHLKSSPEGHVAGNDTACCMPFGSGKNNIYMYNLACATLTVQRETGDKYRTVAQSVMTPDVDIQQNVSEVLNSLMEDHQQLHDVLEQDLGFNSEIFLTADNIEVSKNFKAKHHLKFLYQDFLCRYIAKLNNKNINQEKIVIGKGYSDLSGFDEEENTFVPLAPPGYSDNTHEKCFFLPFDTEVKIEGAVAKEHTFDKKNESEEIIQLPKGVRPLTYRDTLAVAYLEGKIYADNESLIQYLHRIGNELLAKDINNTRKDRKNLSLAVEDKNGKISGYIIAYEGVLDKYDEESQPVIYVSDLASREESLLAGGKLMKGLQTMIEENYLRNDNPIPLLAEARESTSYPIIQKQINKLGRKYGYRFEIEELEDYWQGEDIMHRMILVPHKV